MYEIAYFSPEEGRIDLLVDFGEFEEEVGQNSEILEARFEPDFFILSKETKSRLKNIKSENFISLQYSLEEEELE